MTSLSPCVNGCSNIVVTCNSSIQRAPLVAYAAAICAPDLGLSRVGFVRGGLKDMGEGRYTVDVLADSGQLFPEPRVEQMDNLTSFCALLVVCSLRETRFKEVQEIADLTGTRVKVMNQGTLGVILATLEAIKNTDNIIGD